MAKETWKEIAGFPKYEVSNKGRVRSWNTRNKYNRDARAEKASVLNQTLKPGNTPYLMVSLYNEKGRKPCLVHQLVTEAFKGARPEGAVCRHINGDSLDNRADNLEWGTPKENTADRYLHGTANFHGGKVAPVLADDEVIDVYIRTQQGESVSSIATDYPHASRETVRLIAVGKARRKVITDFLASLRSRSVAVAS